MNASSSEVVPMVLKSSKMKDVLPAALFIFFILCSQQGVFDQWVFWTREEAYGCVELEVECRRVVK